MIQFIHTLVLVIGLVLLPTVSIAETENIDPLSVVIRIYKEMHAGDYRVDDSNSYAGDRRYLLQILTRRTQGWPHIATLILDRETDQLLMMSFHHYDNTTLVFVDDGYLQGGVATGRFIQLEPATSGSRFYNAYRMHANRPSHDSAR